MFYLRRFSYLAVVACIALTPAPLVAEPNPPETAKPSAEMVRLVDEYFNETKMIDALRINNDCLFNVANIEQCACATDAKMLAKLKSAWIVAVAKETDPAKIQEKMKQQWRKTFAPAQMRYLIAFYRSPTGRKVTKALVKEQPKGVDIEEPMAKIIQATRKAILLKIADTLGGVESQVDLMLGVARATATGMQSAVPKNQPRMAIDDINRTIAAQKNQVMTVLEPMLAPGYHLAFKKLSDDELSEYLAHLSSPTGSSIYKRGLQIYQTVMNETATAIGNRFGRILQSQDS